MTRMLAERADKPCALFAKLTPGLWIIRNHDPGVSLAKRTYRQDGSQICMFHVDCEIGMPVKIGYIHAKFVSTSAT